MADSPVSICNQALSQMGARAQVTSINPSDGSLEADVASLLYQTQVDNVSRAAHWNCLRLQRNLTLLRAAAGTPENINGTTLPLPPVPWLYEYALPSDSLQCRFVIPLPTQAAVSPPLTTGNVSTMPYQTINTAMPFVPAVDYNSDVPPTQIAVILTNAPRAQLVYTARIDNPNLWDAAFKNAVISVLSAWFVNPLNMSTTLLSQRISLAQGLVASARLSDGNEGIQSMDHVPDWISARFRSGGLPIANSPYYLGWNALSLPNGISF